MGYQHEHDNARARCAKNCAYPRHTGCMVTITVRAIFSKPAWAFTRSFAAAFAV